LLRRRSSTVGLTRLIAILLIFQVYLQRRVHRQYTILHQLFLQQLTPLDRQRLLHRLLFRILCQQWVMASSPTHLSVSDGDLKPKPFKGTETDTEKTEQWLEYFHTYAAFRQVTGPARLQLFRLLLVDQAAEWWRSLPDDVVRDFDRLVDAFRRRYYLADVKPWKKATTIWQRDQKADESVAAYITAVQNLCKYECMCGPTCQSS